MGYPATPNDWRKSEIIKGVLLFFAIGVAWATLTLQVRSVSKAIENLDYRLDHLEQYITKETHGDFMRLDPPNQ